MQFGMRDCKRGNFDDRVTEEKNIDVDCARTFFLLALPPHTLLKGQKPSDQLPGHFFRIQFHDAVQKPRLRGQFNRLSFIKT